MKGSSVAFRFKSLADRLHPQLPLSPKESQKLLSAVTGSFRTQLEEAHPWSGDIQRNAPKSGFDHHSRGKLPVFGHSSALLTDRHLASVLTNPLVSKAVVPEEHGLDYAAAQTALETGSETDPMALFERSVDKDCLTIPLALLCLHSVAVSFDCRTANEREDAYHHAQAGKRTLKWLLESDMLHDEQLLNNKRFTRTLVSFLVKEGNERFVWEWIKINARRTPSAKPGESAGLIDFVEQGKRHEITDGLLDALVMTKLEQQPESVHDALQTFLKACETVEGCDNREIDRAAIALESAGQRLLRLLTSSFTRRSKPDTTDYDRFIAAMPLWIRGQQAFLEFNRGLLLLLHPSKPSSQEAYRVLRIVLGEATPLYAQALRRRFETYKSAKEGNRLYQYMLKTAVLAQKEGQGRQASWIISKAKLYFPDLALTIDSLVKPDQGPQKPTPRVIEETHPVAHGSLHPSYG